MKKRYTIKLVRNKPIAFETLKSFLARGGQIKKVGDITRINFRNEIKTKNAA